MEMETKKGMGVNLIDKIKGDKVLLIIYLCLTLFSVLTLFSSTSLLVSAEKSRLDLFFEQVLIVLGGMLLVFVCYKFLRIKLMRFVAKYLFIVSALALFLLVVVHLKIPHILEAQYINQAWRNFLVFGRIQVHVFEVVKVFMVLYLAWAVQAWYNKWGEGSEHEYGEEDLQERESEFGLTEFLAYRYEKLEFLDSQKWEEIVYIFFPIGIICLMILPGSNSSMFFIGMVMIVTVLIGGFSLKSTLKMGAICFAIIGSCFLINLKSEGKVFSFLRAKEIVTRFTDARRNFDDEYVIKAEQLKRKEISRKEFKDFIDDNRQVQGALIAVHDGKNMKGPGGSTQKYSVASIFGDFMYSFIIEEYGIFGGILILILFGSLLARGIYITQHCQGVFARTLVGGLSILISGQALMHIAVNVKLMPMTGQTLPLISDGKTAFVMFSIAFGILLAISRIASKNIEEADKETAEYSSEGWNTNIHSGLEELNDFDSSEEDVDDIYDDYKSEEEYKLRK